MLWPLFHYETSPDTLSIHALPLYWHSRTPNRSFTAVFPLYWSLSSGEESTRLVLPFYGVHQKGEWYRLRSFLVPVYFDIRDDHAGLSRQSALFWLYNRRVKGDEERTWFIPLYYHEGYRFAFKPLAVPPTFTCGNRTGSGSISGPSLAG